MELRTKIAEEKWNSLEPERIKDPRDEGFISTESRIRIAKRNTPKERDEKMGHRSAGIARRVVT
jgi:hypothetical protein